MRGTPILLMCFRLVQGIIPAHAGNTTMMQSNKARHWDHPRACGEHTTGLRCCSTVWGSSPRMRGTHSDSAPGANRDGIIPAHAGNTCMSSRRRHPKRDHPRACGEHGLFTGILAANPGSSPRMRGTRRRSAVAMLKAGIIPAHAGNTRCRSVVRRGPRDHPRACGEHDKQENEGGALQGSSPRMRGTPPSAILPLP